MNNSTCVCFVIIIIMSYTQTAHICTRAIKTGLIAVQRIPFTMFTFTYMYIYDVCINCKILLLRHPFNVIRIAVMRPSFSHNHSFDFRHVLQEEENLSVCSALICMSMSIIVSFTNAHTHICGIEGEEKKDCWHRLSVFCHVMFYVYLILAVAVAVAISSQINYILLYPSHMITALHFNRAKFAYNDFFFILSSSKKNRCSKTNILFYDSSSTPHTYMHRRPEGICKGYR